MHPTEGLLVHLNFLDVHVAESVLVKHASHRHVFHVLELVQKLGRNRQFVAPGQLDDFPNVSEACALKKEISH